MLVSIFFDSTAAVARVSDLRFPLLSQSLVPLQSENQLVTTKAVSPKRRSLGSARASRAGDCARAIANFGQMDGFTEFSAGAPKGAREARALPRSPRRDGCYTSTTHLTGVGALSYKTLTCQLRFSQR